MSDYRDVAGWCEVERGVAVGTVITANGPAHYPQDEVGLAVAMILAVIEQETRA